MTNVIERCAKAIYESRNGHGAVKWANRDIAHKTPYRTDSEAALSALKPGDALPNGLTVSHGWQPIETAPKNGVVIIGAFFSIRWADSHRRHDIVRCWWQPEFDAFISSCREMSMAPGYTIDGKVRSLHSPVIEPITHWMPLPAKPEGVKE